MRLGRVGLAALLTAGIVGTPPARAATDHHLHLMSPALAGLMARLAQLDPETAKLLDPEASKSRDAAHVLGLLDAAGLQHGVLLSGGYMFSSPMLADMKLDAAKLVREENAYNVAAAAASGGRLLAFIGLNPLAPEADAELDHWIRAGGARGVKLHLGNSRFDYRDATHLARLRALLATANAARLAVVLHARSAPQYGAAEARLMVEQVLPAAAEVPVQIAHGGGWGGLDDGTLDALEVYVGAIERGAPGTRQLVIDLALVTLGEDTPLPLRERAVALIRRAGVKRFVMGSDWPAIYAPPAHEAYLRRQLPLTDEEWQALLANDAPYVR
ncbi:MAG: amidohydrolase family protein [Gammaproteobacteria bacterium]